jgi:4a-hydroxytetrahydrobiopterin dehydratase
MEERRAEYRKSGVTRMGKPVRLAEEKIAARLPAIEARGWVRKDEKWIERKYRFPTFRDAIAFVVAVGDEAEAMLHHPLISIDYRMVTLRLTTWSAGGLTELDFQSADAYDRIYEQMNP